MLKVKVKWSLYRPGVAQRVGRGIALLFHDRGTRRGWVVSVTPRPLFTPGKDFVPILQEAGWAPGPVWTGGKSRRHGDSIPDRPARSSDPIPTKLPGPTWTYISSMTAALEGCEWSASRPGRSLPLEKTWYPLYRRLGGPQGRSGRAENLFATGIRSRNLRP